MKSVEFNNKRKSFTLIEALMAVAMFMIITTILINIYVATIRSERIAYTILRDSDVTQNVLESIARAIRMGSDFESVDGKNLKFVTEEEGTKFTTMFRYTYDENTKRGWIERIKDVNKPGDFIRLTPDNMSIEDFEFKVFGSSKEQENILIKFNAISRVYGNDYKTFVQTAVTPRLIISN